MGKKGVEAREYYKRLTQYPTTLGSVNQLEAGLDKLAKDPISRRAIATTRVPEIDLFREGSNYLEEIQLRAYLEGSGLILNIYSRWGNDGYNHSDMCDEMTELHEKLARRLGEKAGTRVKTGSCYIEQLGISVSETGESKIPSISIVADTIPEAYWKLEKAVHEQGFNLRTQYDRRDRETGEFLDPPSKDARVVVQINQPFGEPRHPILSFCERGKYIAEFLGAKDHLVVPYPELLDMVRTGQELQAKQWPYLYHQRLDGYPKRGGGKLSQLEVMLDMLAENLNTQDAIASTRVPEVDLILKEDQPCLGQIQLLAEPNDQGQIVLNMIARWRSRDLYKAWGDNLIGITNLFTRLAQGLSSRTGKEVVIGYYEGVNGSLHNYGQDYTQKGMDVFFEKFPTKEAFIKRSWTSEKVLPLILEELGQLKTETTWNFPQESIDLINQISEDFSTGRFIP